MKNFLERFLVPVVFLAVFIVTISALQANKKLLEHADREIVNQAVDLLEQASLDEISKHIDSHYWDAENISENSKVLAAYKEQLSAFGSLKKRHAAIFSVRSARIPEKNGAMSDIFVIHADFDNGKMIYTIGFTLDGMDNQKNWQIDRLTVNALPQHVAENQAAKNEYKISILCSEEKGIEKKCRKDKSLKG